MVVKRKIKKETSKKKGTHALQSNLKNTKSLKLPSVQENKAQNDNPIFKLLKGILPSS